MCGRFALSPITDNIEHLIPNTQIKLKTNSFNICPTASVEGILLSRVGEYIAGNFIWGLNLNNGRFVFNSRIESLISASIYESMKNFRVIIPATAFYEWRRISSSNSVPYCVKPIDNNIFGFAGIYTPNAKNEISALSILTCPANASLNKIHSRMPVIIDSSNAREYLDVRNDFTEFSLPYQPEKMNVYAVEDYVNSAKIDSELCLAPRVENRLF